MCDGVQKSVFAGRSCYCDLGGDVRARIQLVTTGHADHYTALKVNILNRTEGDVDALLFRFGDVWGNKQVSNSNFKDGIIPYIWVDGKDADWYVYHPNNVDFKQLVTELSAYLSVFTDRSYVREKESVTEKLREAKQNSIPKQSGPERKKQGKSGPEL